MKRTAATAIAALLVVSCGPGKPDLVCYDQRGNAVAPRGVAAPAMKMQGAPGCEPFIAGRIAVAGPPLDRLDLDGGSAVLFYPPDGPDGSGSTVFERVGDACRVSAS